MVEGEYEPGETQGEALSNEHLLGLVLEINGIKESAASQKLEVGLNQVKKWTTELEAEGYVEVTEKETGDCVLKITPQGLERVKKLRKKWLADEEEEAKPVVDKKQVMNERKEKIKKAFSRVGRILKELSRDIILVGSTLVSLYLIKVFIDNPNAEVLSFLFGSILLSIVLILYHQYKKYLKTTKVLGFMQWIEQLAEAQKNYIALTLISLFLIYVTVMFVTNPQFRGVYLILAALFLASAALIYVPKKTVKGALRFYLGISLMMYALTLIIGWMKLTGLVFETESRLIDVGVGLALLVIVHLNESVFGVRESTLKKIADRI